MHYSQMINYFIDYSTLNEFVVFLLLASPAEEFTPIWQYMFHLYHERFAHGVRDPVSLASKLFSKQLLS